MAESLDEIVVTIKAETEKFEKGMDNVNSSLDDFQKDTKKTSTSTKDLQKSFEQTGDSAADMGGSMDNAAESTAGMTDVSDELADSAGNSKDKVESLAKGLQTEATAADKAATSNQKAAVQTRTFGEKMDDAINKAFNLKDALKALAGGFTAVALVNAIKQVIDKLIEADKAVVNLRNDLKTITTSQVDADKYENIVTKEKNKLKGDYTEQERINVIVEVERDFGDLDESYKLELKQAILAASSASGMSEVQLTDSLRELMSKWDIPLDEAIAYLRQIEEISSNQAGDFAENFQANIQALTTYDDMAQQMGWSYEELLKYMASLDTWENGKDVNETLELWYRQWTAWQSDQKEASENIPELKAQIEAVQKEIASATASGEDTSDLYVELNDLKQSLADAEQTVSMTFQDFVTSLMQGTDYAGLEGKDLEEMSQARDIKLESENVTIPELDTSYLPDVENSISTGVSNAVGTVLEGVVTTFNPNESFAEYKEENSKLKEEIYYYLKDNYGAFDELTREFMNGFTQIDAEYGGRVSQQEAQELIREYIIKFDQENLEGKFTSELTEADELQTKIDNATESTKDLNTELKTAATVDLSGTETSLGDVAVASETAAENLKETNKQVEEISDPIEDVDTKNVVDGIDDVTDAISGNNGLTDSVDDLTDALDDTAKYTYDQVIPATELLIEDLYALNIDITALTESMRLGAENITTVVIPANTALVASLEAVAAAYWAVAAAKEAAGM